jgi:hypothetical protein
VLAAKIRQRAELSSSRIILLTSGERPGDRDRMREMHNPTCSSRSPRTSCSGRSTG